jgi:hypothetical protein
MAEKKDPENFNSVFLLLADSCECGSEPSGSTKYGEFLD